MCSRPMPSSATPKTGSMSLRGCRFVGRRVCNDHLPAPATRWSAGGCGAGVASRHMVARTSAFSRRDAPELCVDCHPREKEGAGKAGCALHRVSCAKCTSKKRTRAYRFSGGIPTFPARWFTDYPELSPVIRICLSPSQARSFASANLTPTLRRQDHTVSPSANALVSRNFRVHRIPPRVRDDRDPPLSSGQTRKAKSLICPTG